MQDLKRMGDGTVEFLDRRMFENYLLDPTSIATVMKECANFRNPHVSAEEVGKWIDSYGKDARFIDAKFCAPQ